MLFNKVYIKHMSESARTPARNLPGDAGFDLFTSELVIIPPKEFIDVPTHIQIAMPENIWGRICGRSSTLRNYGCMVAEGIIDTGYRGHLFVGVWNLTDRPVTIEVGDRLGQLIFHQHAGPVEWVNTVDLPQSQRGSSGFGSSGR